MLELPSCEVSLGTKEIRFLGDNREDKEAQIRAAEKRAALVELELKARSGLTNRNRRALNRETNCLHEWLALRTGFSRTAAKADSNAEREARREKATRKKLYWLARKAGSLTDLKTGHAGMS
jgi:hypothetical protein